MTPEWGPVNDLEPAVNELEPVEGVVEALRVECGGDERVACGGASVNTTTWYDEVPTVG